VDLASRERDIRPMHIITAAVRKGSGPKRGGAPRGQGNSVTLRSVSKDAVRVRGRRGRASEQSRNLSANARKRKQSRGTVAQEKEGFAIGGC